jgi:hypothetical protein
MLTKGVFFICIFSAMIINVFLSETVTTNYLLANITALLLWLCFKSVE